MQPLCPENNLEQYYPETKSNSSLEQFPPYVPMVKSERDKEKFDKGEERYPQPESSQKWSQRQRERDVKSRKRKCIIKYEPDFLGSSSLQRGHNRGVRPDRMKESPILSTPFKAVEILWGEDADAFSVQELFHTLRYNSYICSRYCDALCTTSLWTLNHVTRQCYLHFNIDSKRICIYSFLGSS